MITHITSDAGFLAFVKQFPPSLKSCNIPSLDEDLAKIANWTAIMDDPEQMSKIATENYIMHKEEYEFDTKYILEYWDSGDYTESGLHVAKALCLLLGYPYPPPPPTYMQSIDVTRDGPQPHLPPNASPDFLTGLL